MIKRIIFLFLLSTPSVINAAELNLNAAEKIIENQPDEKTEIIKSIYTTQTEIENLENKIHGIEYLLDQDLNRKKYNNKKNVWEKLKRAKWHLLSGNTQAALDEANSSLPNIDINDNRSKTFALKIIFESHRILKQFKASTNICSNMLHNDPKNKSFDDKWKLLCSLSYLKASQEKQDDYFKKMLRVWSLSTFSSNNSNYQILNKTLIALAIRNLDPSSNEALEYLHKSLLDAKVNDPALGKSYIVYALLLYENGKKDESFEIIKAIASKNNKNYKKLIYFEPDEETLLLAKHSYARFEIINGNLPSAVAWYNNLLSEGNSEKSQFLTKEKNSAQLEYAKLLYQTRDYPQSSLILENLLQSETQSSLIFSPNHQFVSRFLLADINSKNMDPKNKGIEELVKLYQESNVDLDYIKNISFDKIKDYDNLKRKMFTISALSIQYGVSTKESEYLVQNFLLEEWIQKNQEENLIQLTNALNSVDQIQYGITHTKSLSAINTIENNFKIIEAILKKLDKFSFAFWKENTNGFQIITSERLELLRSINALHDIITENENRINNKRKYEENIIDKIKEIEKNTRTLKAQYADVRFLQQDMDDSSKKFNSIDNQIQAMVLQYRRSLLRNEIFPNSFYTINQKYDEYDYAAKRLSSLHLNFVQDDLLKQAWNSLVEVINQNNKLLDLVTQKLNKDRKSILTKTDLIIKKIQDNESGIEEVKNKSFKEIESMAQPLVVQLENQIKKFQDKINFSFADQKKYSINMLKSEIAKETDVKKKRESWYQTLEKSTERGLFR